MFLEIQPIHSDDLYFVKYFFDDLEYFFMILLIWSF